MRSWVRIGQACGDPTGAGRPSTQLGIATRINRVIGEIDDEDLDVAPWQRRSEERDEEWRGLGENRYASNHAANGQLTRFHANEIGAAREIGVRAR